MKLLLISDRRDILDTFERRESSYLFESIEIHFVYTSEPNFIVKAIELLKNRYHLIISFTLSEFKNPEFILHNAINNFGTEKIKNYIASNISTPWDINPSLSAPSIVNRTTAYFNIFLPIDKAVSISLSTDEEIPEMKRLDIISSINYSLALICHCSNTPYYILNYNKLHVKESQKAFEQLVTLLD